MDEIISKAIFATTERWLYNLSKWRAEIVVLQEQLNDHTGKVTVGYTQGGSGGGGTGDGTFARATVVLEAEGELPRLLTKALVIEAALKSLPDSWRRLVDLKYISGWDNSLVWCNMSISEAEFYRDRRDAIAQLNEILWKDWLFRQDVEGKVVKIREKIARELARDEQVKKG